MKDFTPTKENISLHGLGFIQLKLDYGRRIHIWHPSLPKRNCFKKSSVHNHRFAFKSLILKGVQENIICDIEIVKPGLGSHNLISHNGPRGVNGSRQSYPVADCNVIERTSRFYHPGQIYNMEIGQYHKTKNKGIVITTMHKLQEGEIHANSVCEKPIDFHYDFDRFQLSEDELFDYVKEAFLSEVQE